jgi:hypothetical protein
MVNVGLVIAGFRLATNVSSVSVARGTSVPVTVTVTGFGFSSAVSLSISNMPAGVTGVFNPKSIVPTASGATGTLTLTASATATKATKTATVKGQAAGVAQQVVNLPITVT